MKIAVTGSSGFVGRALVSYFETLSVDFVCIDRVKPFSRYLRNPRQVHLDYSDNASLVSALSGSNVVIHLAGRAHQKSPNNQYSMSQFHNANVICLQSVVNASIEAGIQRIVFVSSIGVLGSSTNGAPFSDYSPPRPSALYAESKLEAEHLLVASLRGRDDIDWVILRPPLIYGPNCPGNIAKLIKFVKKLPVVPFGSMNSRKSFVSIKNFVNILYLCTCHPRVSRKAFVVSDCDDISVAEMFAYLLYGLNISKFRLLRFPRILMFFLSKIFGVSGLYQQVVSELLVDPSGFLAATGWVPLSSCRDELKLTAKSFK